MPEMDPNKKHPVAGDRVFWHDPDVSSHREPEKHQEGGWKEPREEEGKEGDGKDAGGTADAGDGKDSGATTTDGDGKDTSATITGVDGNNTTTTAVTSDSNQDRPAYEPPTTLPPHTTARPKSDALSNDTSATTTTSGQGVATTGAHAPTTCSTSGGYAFDQNGNPCFPFNQITSKQFIMRVSSEGTKYMYCAIPKNGCSVHLGIMHRLEGRAFEGGPNVHPPDKQVSLNLDGRGEEFVELLRDDNVPKYIIIRNPIERVLSGYLDKVERFLPEEERTPGAFVKWARDNLQVDMSWTGVNAHWRAQTTLCGYALGNVHSYFRVFRAEEPAKYVDFLYEFLPERVTKDGWGGTWNKSLREYILGPYKRTVDAKGKFEEYIGAEGDLKLFDFLVEVYEVDVSRLGYGDTVRGMRKSLQKRFADGGEQSSEKT